MTRVSGSSSVLHCYACGCTEEQAPPGQMPTAWAEPEPLPSSIHLAEGDASPPHSQPLTLHLDCSNAIRALAEEWQRDLDRHAVAQILRQLAAEMER